MKGQRNLYVLIEDLRAFTDPGDPRTDDVAPADYLRTLLLEAADRLTAQDSKLDAALEDVAYWRNKHSDGGW